MLGAPLICRSSTLRPACLAAAAAVDHPGVETWASLADDADMLPSQASRFVRTDSHDGLLWRDFVRLCGIFGVDPHDCPGTHVRVVAGRALDWPVLV